MTSLLLCNNLVTNHNCHVFHLYHFWSLLPTYVIVCYCFWWENVYESICTIDLKPIVHTKYSSLFAEVKIDRWSEWFMRQMCHVSIFKVNASHYWLAFSNYTCAWSIKLDLQQNHHFLPLWSYNDVIMMSQAN